MKTNSRTRFITAAIVAALTSSSFSNTGNPCGNSTPGGPSEPPDPCAGAGANLFSSYTGNAHREVIDIRVFGSVGQMPLHFARMSNTRMSPQSVGQGRFGRESVWTHNYQWHMRDVANYSNGQPAFRIAFPDGRDNIFVQDASQPAQWLATADSAFRVTQNGSEFALLTADGVLHKFQKRTNSNSGATFYRLETEEDAAGNVYTHTYNNGNDTLVRQVTDPSGRWLKFTYANLGAYAQQKTVYGSTPYNEVSGEWHEITVTNTTPNRYLTLFCDNDFHNAPALPVGEIEFYDENDALILGTPFGSEPFEPGHGPVNAFDGDPGSYYRYDFMRNGYVGIDCGAPKVVSRIRYFVPAGVAGTIASAQFTGLTETGGSNNVIKSVASSDGRSVVYNYSLFTDPSGWFRWNLLDSVNYPDGTNALYSYTQTHDFTRPILNHAIDPRLRGDAVMIEYQFDGDAALGFLKVEKSGLTGEEVAHSDFDSAHKPKDVYPNGRVVKYEYSNLNANLTKKTDGLGHIRTFTYDAGGAGQLASVSDALGRTTNYITTALGSPLTTTLPDGTVQSWTRDSRERVLTSTLSGPGIQPRTTTYTRDASGRVTRIDHPDATFELWTYNSFGQVLSHTQRNGGVESLSYSASGLLLSRADALGNTTSYTYDNRDRIATVTNARGFVTAYAYNDRGQVTFVTHPGGAAQSFVYDDFGNLIQTTNELGNVWASTFDEFKRKTSETDPLARTTLYAYGDALTGGCSACNAGGQVTLITLPSGKKTRFVYDVEWRRTSQIVGWTSADEATTTFAYNGVNEMTSMTDPAGSTVSYSYDNRDRLATQTDPLSRVYSYSYDAAGNTLTTTRPDGGVTTNVFDSMDRLLSSTDPKNQTTSYAYDAQGNTLSLTDARGNAYSWTYDLLSRATQKLYPDSSTEQWTYDGVSNRLTAKTRAGSVMTCTFDSRNRETACAWNDGNTPNITRTFDAASRLLSSANGNATCDYTYDAANQNISETQTLSALGQSFTLTFTHDPDGNRASVTYPSGQVVAYTYTGRNQVKDVVADGPPPLAAYAYNLDGTRATKTLENGDSTAYGFNAAKEVIDVLHQTAANVTLQSFGYTYDNVGRRKTMRVDGAGFDVYGYDAVDQVTSVKYNGADVNGSSATREVAYSHDAVGNRQSVAVTGSGDASLPPLAGGTTAYAAANTVNQYPTVGGQSVNYDANGNLTLAVVPPAAGNTILSYSYDSQNRLTQAVGSNPASNVTSAYDTRNRQVKRVVNGTTTYFVWDDWNLIEERDASGALTQNYVHGAETDEILSKTNSSGTVYYHLDALGNVTALSNDQGQLIERYRFDIYGKAAIIDPVTSNQLTASAFGNRFLFTGREWIAEAALYDYRNRVYSQELGRFLQTDPIRFDAGDVNLYRYVGSSVPNYRDPTGKFAIQLSIAAIAAIAALVAAAIAWPFIAPHLPPITPPWSPSPAPIVQPYTPPSSPPYQPPTNTPSIPSEPSVPDTQIPSTGTYPDFTGTPGSTVETPDQTRTYGPDGYPETDHDKPHHGHGDHCHDWGRPAGGGPPTKEDRGPHRDPRPGDPPAPSNSPFHTPSSTQ